MKPAPIALATLALTAGIATNIALKPAPAQAAASAAANTAAQPGLDMGAMLVGALNTSPGCLGAEAMQTSTGKGVIIAWFEDAVAARAWYRHPVHMRMVSMASSAEEAQAHQPLAAVADDTPVMVIATITPSDKPEVDGIPIPIKQISIELYTTLPGGAAFNGRLAPEAFPIPKGMAGYEQNDDANDAE